MRKEQVVLGRVYLVKVSGRLADVLLESTDPNGGWQGRNTRTGRSIRIKTAAKLRKEVQP